MRYHTIYRKQYKSWAELEKVIEALPTTKELGNAFEDFVYGYLMLNKTLYQISEVYKVSDIPVHYRKKYNLEKMDSGIDGLMILNNGLAAGYQAKFRANRIKPSYAELSKFWAEARDLDYHYTIANTYSLTGLSKKNNKHLSILVEEFENLSPEFFSELFALTNNKTVKKTFYQPDGFQKTMIKRVVKGFEKHDRGKLIAACGTGKTLTSLWITESLETNEVLFIAPSIALIKQTLEAWATQSKNDFSYLCVCSDKSVSDEVDSGDIDLNDLTVPVTTDANEITAFLQKKSNKLRIIFSTYQSLGVLSKALNGINKFSFDLIIFDEAHRTAGAKNSSMFSLALHDEYIHGKHRLFMTATERLVRPWIIKKAEEQNRIVFSMDDETLYGPTFDRLNFGEAIKNKIISDYRIIVAGIKQKEIFDLISNNNLLVDVDENSEEFQTSAQNVFRQVMLCKAMEQFPIKKTITFHSTVKQAREFLNGTSRNELSLRKAFSLLNTDIQDSDLYLNHVNGEMPAGDRVEILDEFKSSPLGIISNARCLTEGIDVPIIDSVYFVNPKNSLIDIVQACGRALRKPRDRHDKIAYFIIPILIPEGEINDESINEIDFEMLHSLIQSLRDQDQRMEEWINKINLEATKKKHITRGQEDSPLILDLPKEFDIKKFQELLYLKVAQVNGNPSEKAPVQTFGKTERKSNFERIFTTLGDYAVDTYNENLVTPTIKKFRNESQIISKAQLTINHNNVSHTVRLGLITENEKGFGLTPLGKQFHKIEIEFNELFIRQMLRYYILKNDANNKRILFPYRTCLKILKEVKSLNFVEFVYGFYSMYDSSDESIQKAIEDINYIKSTYPSINILNEANKEKVLNELNEHFGKSFLAKDIWLGKTTIANQFIYFRNHLSLFTDVLTTDKTGIKIIPGCEAKIQKILDADKIIEKEKNFDSLHSIYIQHLIVLIIFSLLKPL